MLVVAHRKLLRTATETTMASDNIVERTPSKLANALLLDRDKSGPPSPLAMVVNTAAGEIADRDTDMNSVSQHLPQQQALRQIALQIVAGGNENGQVPTPAL